MKQQKQVNLDNEATAYQDSWQRTYPQVPMSCEWREGKEGPELAVTIRGTPAGRMHLGAVRQAVRDFNSNGREETYPCYRTKFEQTAGFV